MVITGATPENAGRYLCVINNRCGERASDEATVVVNPTVSVDEDPTNAFSVTAGYRHGEDRIDVRFVASRPNTSIQLIALDGSRISSVVVDTVGESTVSLRTDTVSSGTYIILVDDGRNAAQTLVQVVR